jgi:hypothetical protein
MKGTEFAVCAFSNHQQIGPTFSKKAEAIAFATNCCHYPTYILMYQHKPQMIWSSLEEEQNNQWKNQEGVK